MPPLVSVILPVHNAERYVKSAIESLLQQSYSNIELIVIDDCSIDSSASIIRSINDPRIRFFSNEINLGIALTLNKAIDYSKGQYIARMDADDLCLPERIEKQLDFLEQNPAYAMVDTVQECIDENGRLLGYTNSNVTKESAIRKILPKRNVLGHPSMMGVASIYKQYKYNDLDYEDYNLWLRLTNDGKRIYKLSEALLLFRVHSTSFTNEGQRKKVHFFRIAKVKWTYLKQLKIVDLIKPFNIEVFAWLLVDLLIAYRKKLF